MDFLKNLLLKIGEGYLEIVAAFAGLAAISLVVSTLLSLVGKIRGTVKAFIKGWALTTLAAPLGIGALMGAVDAVIGCCQSNANRSPKSARSGLSGRKLTPFGQSGRSILLEDIAAV
jgi:hypothetical protein